MPLEKERSQSSNSLHGAAESLSEEREQRIRNIAEQIRQLPETSLTKMYYFATATGCANICQMCSTRSTSTITRITEEGLYDLIGAINIVQNERANNTLGKPYVTGSRMFKPGHVLLYYDDDPAAYPYTDKCVEWLHTKLGVRSAISTVGLNHHSKELQIMHERIAANSEAMREFRISYSTFPQGVKHLDNFSADLSHLLRIYRPLRDYIGIGRNGMRMEIHTRPLVYSENRALDDEEIDRHHVIHSGPYLFISRNQKDVINQAKIIDYGGPDGTHPIFDTNPLPYLVVVSDARIGKNNWRSFAKEMIQDTDNLQTESSDYQQYKNSPAAWIRKASLYSFSNADGPYYMVDPTFHPQKGYFRSIHIYPQTERRKRSGVLDMTRFIMNSLVRYKEGRGMGWLDSFPEASWDDVSAVISNVENMATEMDKYNRLSAEYIRKEILLLMKCYAGALRKADYEPSFFFEPQFTVDTGVIGNIGRATKEFGGLVSEDDIPIHLDDHRILTIYRRRGEAWSWVPVPMRGSNNSKIDQVTRGKNGNLRHGVIAVSRLDRNTISPIPNETSFIHGIPMEEVTYKEAVKANTVPGLLYHDD